MWWRLDKSINADPVEHFQIKWGQTYGLEFDSSFLIGLYRGSPTYAVFTIADPTTVVFGLCTRKCGIFALVEDPLQSH